LRGRGGEELRAESRAWADGHVAKPARRAARRAGIVDDLQVDATDSQRLRRLSQPIFKVDNALVAQDAFLLRGPPQYFAPLLVNCMAVAFYINSREALSDNTMGGWMVCWQRQDAGLWSRIVP
jgi:hypothetical protein